MIQPHRVAQLVGHDGQEVDSVDGLGIDGEQVRGGRVAEPHVVRVDRRAVDHRQSAVESQVSERVGRGCEILVDGPRPGAELVERPRTGVHRDASPGEVLWKDFLNVFLTDIPAARVGWASLGISRVLSYW